MPKVSEIMKRPVITTGPEATISAIAKIMTNNRVGSVIIMEGGKPIGIVTNDDVVTVVAEGEDPAKVMFSGLKKKGLVSVGPDEDIFKAAKLMIKTGFKRMPVIKDGKLLGMVSEKEILLVSPEIIELLSEKLRARVERVAQPDERISGMCEGCDGYSDNLKSSAGRWLCKGCRG